MYVEQQTKRPAYKNAKTHNVYHRCLCFLIKLPWPKNKSLCDTIFLNIMLKKIVHRYKAYEMDQ